MTSDVLVVKFCQISYYIEVDDEMGRIPVNTLGTDSSRIPYGIFSIQEGHFVYCFVHKLLCRVELDL